MGISKALKSKLKGLNENEFVWVQEITKIKKKRLIPRINGRKYYG